MPAQHRRPWAWAQKWGRVARSTGVALGAAVVAGATAGWLINSGPRGGMLALGAVGAYLLAVVVLSHPTWGGYVLVGVTPAVSGLGRGVPIPGFRVSEVLIAWVGLILIARAALTGRSPEWTSFDAVAALYVSVSIGMGVIDLIRGDPGGFSAANLGTVFGPVQFVLLYIAVRITVKTEFHRRCAIGTLLAGASVVSLLGIGQRAHVLGLERILPRITDSTVAGSWSLVVEGRITSVFPQWQMLSAYEYIVLLIAATCLMRRSPLGLCQVGSHGLGRAGERVHRRNGNTNNLFGCVRWRRCVGGVESVRNESDPASNCGVGALGVVFFSLIATRYATQYGDGGGGGVLPHNAAFRIHVWVSQWLPVISHHILTGVGPTIPTAGVIWTSTESLYVTLLLRGGAPLLAAFTPRSWWCGLPPPAGRPARASRRWAALARYRSSPSFFSSPCNWPSHTSSTPGYPTSSGLSSVSPVYMGRPNGTAVGARWAQTPIPLVSWDRS